MSCIKKFVVAATLSGLPFSITIAQNITNHQERTGSLNVFSISANLDVNQGSGNIGGRPVTSGAIVVGTGARFNNLTNDRTINGDTNIYAAGQVIEGSIVLGPDARARNVTNTHRRDGDLTIIAASLQGSLANRSVGLSGSVTSESVVICSGSVGNVTNSSKTQGKTMLVGSNVTYNSVSVGC